MSSPTEQTPCAATLAQGRGKTWFVHYRENGRPQRVSTSTTDYQHARAWLAAFEAARRLFA